MNRSLFTATKFPIFQIDILFFFKNGLNQENKNSFTTFSLLMKSNSRFFSSSPKIYYKDNKNKKSEKSDKNEKDEESQSFSFSTNETQVGRKETEEKVKEKENLFQKFKFELKKNSKQPKRDLGVSGYNRGKLFVGIKKDFSGFIINCLIISVFLYSLFTLAPKETISQRRKRIIRERLMKEYEINEQDLELLEDFNEVVEK